LVILGPVNASMLPYGSPPHRTCGNGMQPTCAGATRPTWPGWRSRPSRSGRGRPDLRAHKARKAPLVRRGRPVSVANPARQARKGRLVLRVRREKLVHRGQRGLRANAAKLDRKAPQVRPVRQDRPAPRVIRVHRLHSASSPAPTTCTAQTTRSWFHSCARAARLMVRGAPRLARQRPYCAPGNEARVGTAPTQAR
jgi:hypothetical protein